MIARTANEPGSRDEETVAHSSRRRLLARDLRLAVQLTVGLSPVGRGEQGRGLVGPRRGVGDVDVAGRDIHPVPGLTAQRVERSTHETRLPRHLDDRIPRAVEQGLVRRRTAPVGSDQCRSVRDCTAFATREAGHPMAAPDRLPRQLPCHPCRSAQNQDLHTETQAPRSPPRQTDSPTADGQRRVRAVPGHGARTRPRRTAGRGAQLETDRMSYPGTTHHRRRAALTATAGARGPRPTDHGVARIDGVLSVQSFAGVRSTVTPAGWCSASRVAAQLASRANLSAEPVPGGTL